MNYYVRNVLGNDVTYYREEDPDIEESDKVLEVDFKAEDSEGRKKNFVDIFENNVWLSKESKSGDGSNLANAKFAMRVLDKAVDLLKRHLRKNVIKMLDSSCGDMNWMKHFLENRTDILFTGYDIVPANIESHRRYFSGRNWNFEVMILNLHSSQWFDNV